MIYLRGNRLDYDSWAENGATGWSYADVLPVFKHFESNDELGGTSTVKHKTGRVQVTQHRGMRFGSAEAYRAPITRRRNLTVRTDTLVTRIIIEQGRAVGVEVCDRNGTTERIDARNEIIVSGGAFNTPALLQHSGIGPADFLHSVGGEADRRFAGRGREPDGAPTRSTPPTS